MRRSNRNKRIDYKLFNETGVKAQSLPSIYSIDENELQNKHSISVDEISSLFNNISIHDNCTDNSSKMCESAIKQLIREQNEIGIEICDFIDEYSLYSNNIDDIDICVNDIKALRSRFRSKHAELKDLMDNEDEYETKFLKNHDILLHNTKIFIKQKLDDRQTVRNSQSKISDNDYQMKNLARDSIIDEIRRLVSELSEDINTDLVLSTDDDIRKRNKSKSDLFTKVNSLSSNYKEMLLLVSDGNTKYEPKVTELIDEYNTVMSTKQVYIKSLQTEVELREIDKEDLFNASSLNIKLPKFNGYSSPIDVYSFQSEFNKLYQKTTPKKLQADLLKNNFLEDSALSLVKSVTDIDEVWSRLKIAYGNPKSLLTKKLAEVSRFGQLWKLKEPTKIIEELTKLINAMKDLIQLAKSHNIEAKLFNGDGLERIYQLMGDSRITKWFSITSDNEELEGEDLWKMLINFLEKEVKVQQQKHLLSQSMEERKKPTEKREETVSLPKRGHTAHPTFQHDSDKAQSKQNPPKCFICNEDDHIPSKGPWGKSIIQYYSCKKFAEMNPAERYTTLKKKNLCTQCLFPGSDQSKGKHQIGKCYRDYTCNHPSHGSNSSKKHILVCSEHQDWKENKTLLEEYRNRFILKQSELPDFSKNIKLSFHVNIDQDTSHMNIIEDNAIYVLQKIQVDNQNYNIFFDTGCSDLVCKYDAVKRVGDRAHQEHEGPVTLGGVGNATTRSTHGIYQVRLPLFNGKNAVLTGVCIDQITSTFPDYPLQGAVIDDIHTEYIKSGGVPEDLPKVAKFVGGAIDFMIGAKYLRYHPKEIFQLPSGLTIYESPFENADGGRGVIGGPHKIFTEIDKYHHASTFLTNQMKMFNMGYIVNPDASLLNLKVEKDAMQNLMLGNTKPEALVARNQKFNLVEEAGSQITYRCPN